MALPAFVWVPPSMTWSLPGLSGTLASAPPGVTLPGVSGRKPSEIPLAAAGITAVPQSVSAFLPGNTSVGSPPPLVKSALARSGPAQCCFGSVPTHTRRSMSWCSRVGAREHDLSQRTQGGQGASADLAGAAGPHQVSGEGKPELTKAPRSDDRGRGNSGRLPLRTAVEGGLARGADALAPSTLRTDDLHNFRKSHKYEADEFFSYAACRAAQTSSNDGRHPRLFPHQPQQSVSTRYSPAPNVVGRELRRPLDRHSLERRPGRLGISGIPDHPSRP